MTKTFENKAFIGSGIYTLPDIAQIFRLPYYKVSRWIKDYWDKRLAIDFESEYSWTDGMSRAISFHTLIELFVFMQLSQAGVNSRDILKAHRELSKLYKTKFPFATSSIINSLSTDGRRVYFHYTGEELSLDGKRQFNLGFVKEFFKNIDFDSDELAKRLWPMGRNCDIIIDPQHHFGQPVILGTNIVPDAIYSMHKAGDSEGFIALIYDIHPKQVKDAIDYCNLAA